MQIDLENARLVSGTTSCVNKALVAPAGLSCLHLRLQQTAAAVKQAPLGQGRCQRKTRPLSQPEQAARPLRQAACRATFLARQVTVEFCICVISFCVLYCLSLLTATHTGALYGEQAACSPMSARCACSYQPAQEPFRCVLISGCRGPSLSTSLSPFLLSVPLFFWGKCLSYLPLKPHPFFV